MLRKGCDKKCLPCFIVVFPCLGRKESDTHDKRLVEFGKCHVVQPMIPQCWRRANTTSVIWVAVSVCIWAMWLWTYSSVAAMGKAQNPFAAAAPPLAPGVSLRKLSISCFEGQVRARTRRASYACLVMWLTTDVSLLLFYHRTRRTNS